MVFFIAVGSQLSQRSSATCVASSRWRHSGSHESWPGLVFPHIACTAVLHACAGRGGSIPAPLRGSCMKNTQEV